MTNLAILWFFFNIILCCILVERHVSHLSSCNAQEVNRLLGMVVDVENIFMSMHREDDHDTKRVYYYLFKVRNIHKYIILASDLISNIVFIFTAFTQVYIDW